MALLSRHSPKVLRGSIYSGSGLPLCLDSGFPKALELAGAQQCPSKLLLGVVGGLCLTACPPYFHMLMDGQSWPFAGLQLQAPALPGCR